MSLVERAARGLLWNQLAKLIEFGLAFGTSIVLARGLGAADFGIYSLVMAGAATALIIIALGKEEALNTFVARYQAEGRLREAAYLVRAYLRGRLALSLLLSIGAAIVALLWSEGPLKQIGPLFWFVIFHFTFSSLSRVLAYFLLGLMDARRVGFVRVISAGLGLSLAALFVWMGLGVGGQLAVLAITSTVTLSLYWVLSRRYLERPERTGMAEPDAFGRSVWGTNAVNYLIGKQSDLLLIGLLLQKTAAVAYYNVAYGFYLMVSSLLLAGTEGISLSAFSEAGKRDPKMLAKAWALHLKLDQAVLIPGMLFVAWYAGPLVTLVYSQEYAASVVALQILLVVGLIARACGGGTTQTALYALGRQRQVLYIRSAVGAINLAANLALILLFGFLGAVVGTAASGAVLALVELYVLRRCLEIRFPAAFLTRVLALAGIALAATLPLQPSGPAGVLLALLVFVLVYAVASLILRPLSDEDREHLARTHPLIKSAVRYL